MYKFILNGVQLPVAPEKFTWSIKSNNETMELINGSEISFLRSPGLTEFSFEFLIPSFKYPFANYNDEGFKKPSEYTNLLERLKSEKKPFRFQVLRTLPDGKILFDTDIKVSLEDYTITESAKEGFDLKAKVVLKQFVEIITQFSNLVTNQNGETVLKKETVRPSEKQIPKTYTVKTGDSLWAICKKQLGDGSKYSEIAKINNISNPNLIYPGQVIKFE